MLAHGGMGAVWWAEDLQLQREIAVKVLLPRYEKSEYEARLYLEARIAGRLFHPGVAPVYDSGETEDHLPYFTMALVRGETLAALLKRRANPAQDLEKLLGIFEKICQTAAYAHTNRVIHRDLKPHNVMVGRFGEVQVLDWGIAKFLEDRPAHDAEETPALDAEREPRAAELAETEESAETELFVSSPSIANSTTILKETLSGGCGTAPDSAGTAPGVVLGTPGYMPPEQARGRIADIDERCDVFALGAILCEILTGWPPYTGENAQQVLFKASHADQAAMHARLDTVAGEAELIALARRCLSPDRAGRPRNAGELARALNAVLESTRQRARAAEIKRAQAEVQWQEERKRHWLRLTGAALGLGLLVTLIAAGLWIRSEQSARRAEQVARFAELRGQAQTALLKMPRLIQEERWGEAFTLLETASQAIGGQNEPVLSQELVTAKKEVALAERLSGSTWQAWEEPNPKEPRPALEKQFRADFAEFPLGEPTDDVGPLVARIAQSRVRPQIIAALEVWVSLEQVDARERTWLLAILQQEIASRHAREGDNSCAPLFVAEVWNEPQVFVARRAELNLKQIPPSTLLALGLNLQRLKCDDLPYWQTVQRLHPGEVRLSFQLARSLHTQHPDLAEAYYRAVLGRQPDNRAARQYLRALLPEKNSCFVTAKMLGATGCLSASANELRRVQPDFLRLTEHLHLLLGPVGAQRPNQSQHEKDPQRQDEREPADRQHHNQGRIEIRLGSIGKPHKRFVSRRNVTRAQGTSLPAQPSQPQPRASWPDGVQRISGRCHPCDGTFGSGHVRNARREKLRFPARSTPARYSGNGSRTTRKPVRAVE